MVGLLEERQKSIERAAPLSLIHPPRPGTVWDVRSPQPNTRLRPAVLSGRHRSGDQISVASQDHQSVDGLVYVALVKAELHDPLDRAELCHGLFRHQLSSPLRRRASRLFPYALALPEPDAEQTRVGARSVPPWTSPNTFRNCSPTTCSHEGSGTTSQERVSGQQPETCHKTQRPGDQEGLAHLCWPPVPGERPSGRLGWRSRHLRALSCEPGSACVVLILFRPASRRVSLTPSAQSVMLSEEVTTDSGHRRIRPRSFHWRWETDVNRLAGREFMRTVRLSARRVLSVLMATAVCMVGRLG